MGGGYRFFALKSGRAVGDASKWKDHGSSDISYISADDTATYGAFARIFERMGLEEAFAPIVQPLRRLRLYTAKFVVRSRCSCPCFHSECTEATALIRLRVGCASGCASPLCCTPPAPP
jgi:hypothetical protein